MIETVKRPYELLVRWREGRISGAHMGFELTTTENGIVLSTSPLSVMSIDIGQGAGFPLADILAQVHTDALIQVDAANAEAKAKTDECDTHVATIAERDATILSLQSNITDLEKKLSAALAASIKSLEGQ